MDAVEIDEAELRMAFRSAEARGQLLEIAERIKDSAVAHSPVGATGNYRDAWKYGTTEVNGLLAGRAYNTDWKAVFIEYGTRPAKGNDRGGMAARAPLRHALEENGWTGAVDDSRYRG